MWYCRIDGTWKFQIWKLMRNKQILDRWKQCRLTDPLFGIGHLWWLNYHICFWLTRSVGSIIIQSLRNQTQKMQFMILNDKSWINHHKIKILIILSNQIWSNELLVTLGCLPTIFDWKIDSKIKLDIKEIVATFALFRLETWWHCTDKSFVQQLFC